MTEPSQGCWERFFRLALWLGVGLVVVVAVLVMLGRRPLRITR